ncbi:murein hydrolase activator EnvC [Motiliproteus sp. SC1-56]|uniref:murein hydrolase activator EnvC family protein n=1 Tax=Motiliproteus sp. SC1-56 TaxID=2799565 RepID=UPI001A8CD4A2|nr:peptidoglycan DD-metalloendopeptidase family protein [Motiliproteus sp. SC1-56]
MALLAGPLAWGAADSEQTQRQIQALKKDIHALEQRLAKARGEKKGLQAALSRAEKEAGKTAGQVEKSRAAIAATRKEMAALQSRREGLLKAREIQQQTLATQLRAAFHTGRQNRIKLLLNQEDPHRVTRMLTYYEYLGRARLQAIEEYEATLAGLNQVESDLEARQLQLEGELAQLQQRSASLQAQRKQREQALAALQRDMRGDQTRLGQLKANSERLQNVLEELRRALDLNELQLDDKTFVQRKGALAWPAQGPVAEHFGARNSLGVKADGMLIAAKAGSPVRAVHHGRVVFADWLRGFGLLLIVDHGGGYMTLYGHNQTLLKEVGDWVQPGETIASVGDSGGRAKAGLYFALRHEGKPRNPAPWLNRSRG